ELINLCSRPSVGGANKDESEAMTSERSAGDSGPPTVLAPRPTHAATKSRTRPRGISRSVANCAPDGNTSCSFTEQEGSSVLLQSLPTVDDTSPELPVSSAEYHSCIMSLLSPLSRAFERQRVSEQPALLQADEAAAADDDVVVQADPHEIAGAR